MCSSPDEMSTQAIEEYVAWMERELSRGSMRTAERRIWEGRLDFFRVILKERAEAGTY